jgi:DNA-binding protein YbaB
VTVVSELTEALTACRDELDRVALELDRARQRRAGERFTATDRHRAVEITVDGSGMVVAVIVADDWPSVHSPGALVKQVMATFDRARRHAVESMQRPLADADPYDEPAGPAVRGRASAETPSGAHGASPACRGEALDALRELSTHVAEQAARVEAAHARTQEHVIGTVMAGRVRATVSGDGALAELSVGDPHGHNTRVTDLGRSIRDAIREAQREAALRQQHLQRMLDKDGVAAIRPGALT